jgi:hypothetical protein
VSRPWMLPLIVAAIVVPVSVSFLVGGPPLGLAVGFLAAATVVLLAARRRPGGTIATVAARDQRDRLLIVLSHELDDSQAIERLTDGNGHERGETEVRVLAPARSRMLDRWASDVGPAREEAQRKLVVSVATLGKARIAAEASVGDEDLVQAVEDELRSFGADEVVLVTGTPEQDPEGERAAAELRERLRQPLTRVISA